MLSSSADGATAAAICTEDPAALLNLNLQREKKIKELREGPKAKENGPEISRLNNQMQRDYRTLILHDVSLPRDIDGLLWKNCFYKQLENYRKAIVARQEKMEANDPSNDDNDGECDQKVYDRAKLELQQFQMVYNNYLSSSIEFYIGLYRELEGRYLTNPNAAIKHKILCHIHRCLLYLGDLTRYQQRYSNDREQNYHESEKYYERAAFLMPTSGNPQNQLAVLASYSDQDLYAVYHYCRSILVKEPFPEGWANLGRAFSKNFESYHRVKKEIGSQQQRSLYVPTIGGGGPTSNERLKKLKSIFFTKFVRLHGILYDWSRFALTLITPKAATVDYNAKAQTLDIEYITSLASDVMDEYDQLLAASTFGESLLLRLIVICIFSVYQGNMVSSPITRMENEIKGISNEENRLNSFRSSTESLALCIIFNLINKTAVRINSLINSSDKGRKGAINRILPVLSVFAEWAGNVPEYLSAGEYPVISKASPLVTSLLVNSDLLRAEGRARSGMRSALTSLHDYIESSLRSLPQSSRSVGGGINIESDLSPLREHIQLRGFLPLSELYENFFSNVEPLTFPKSSLSEEASRDRRLRVLRSFLRDWLKPMAAREAAEAENRRAELQKSKMEADMAKAGKGGAVGGLLSMPTSTQLSHKDKLKQKKTRRERRAESSRQKRSNNASSSKMHRGILNSMEMEREDFPPLTISNVSAAASAAANKYQQQNSQYSFASSNIYLSHPPTTANPFGDAEEGNPGDEEDYDDDDDEDDDENVDDDDDDDDDDYDDNHEVNDNLLSVHTSGDMFTLGSNWQPPISSAATSSSDFGGLLVGNPNLYRDLDPFSIKGGASAGVGLGIGMDMDIDDDVGDEVVFQPAFSRVIGNISPALPPHTSMAGLGGGGDFNFQGVGNHLNDIFINPIPLPHHFDGKSSWQEQQQLNAPPPVPSWWADDHTGTRNGITFDNGASNDNGASMGQGWGIGMGYSTNNNTLQHPNSSPLPQAHPNDRAAPPGLFDPFSSATIPPPPPGFG